MKKRQSFNRWLLPLSAVLILIVVIASTTRAFRNRPKNQVQETVTSPSSPIKETSTPPRAKSPNEIELAHLMDAAIETSDFASARWGVCVLSLRDGHVLYARNADKLFTPASNMKFTPLRWRLSCWARITAGGHLSMRPHTSTRRV